ncbi:CAMP factor family pore-forming toxin [Anaerococcus cruorum]|uniref:cAMP factor family pore-forming toxin n=1 Tax=Anaerococcus cruorum TaxID=3115617 RepID=A0ABW9MUK9_9FIRM
MGKKYKLFSVFTLVTFLLTSLPLESYAKSYDASTEQREYESSDMYLSEIEKINEDYDLRLSDDELRQESSVLQGARIEGDKAYEIPLMQQAQSDLVELCEDRNINLPGGINTQNPQQFFYIGSVGVRIQLLRRVSKFVNEMTTEHIYKIQEAHNKAAQIAFEAVMVAINPFNGRKDVLKAIEKFDENAEKIRNYRDLTSGDQATTYVKRLMYKNITEARRAQNRYFSQGDYGTRGKEEYIQNIFKSEVNDIYKQVGQKITFGQLIELDARLKSASSSALLSAEVIANPKWISETINKEINKQNKLKGQYRNQISKDDYDRWQGFVKKLTDRKIERNPRYDRIAEASYDLWDFNIYLINQYPDVFTKDLFGDFNLFIPPSYIEPYQVADIKWIVSPTFDKIPQGMQAQSSNIIIGFGAQQAQYGDYNSYVTNRSTLRDEVITTNMDGSRPELVYPDFTDPNY